MIKTKNKSVLLWVSSLTGNTRKVAEALICEIQDMGYSIFLAGSPSSMVTELRQQYQLEEAGEELIHDERDLFVILCFWCRRASIDDRSLEFLHGLQDRKLLFFGTMGSYPDSAYGDQVYQSVETLAGKSNRLAGIYLCRGKIDENRTKKRRSLPPSHRHYLDDEGYKRHLSSHGHPDEEDIRGAVRFLRDHLYPVSYD